MKSKGYIHRNNEIIDLENLSAEEKEHLTEVFSARLSAVISEYFTQHPEELKKFMQGQYT